MSVEENRIIVRRYFNDLWSKGDLDAANEIISPNIVVHDTFVPPGAYGSGAAGFGQFVGSFRTAFPDAHATMDDEILEGDKAAVRWTLSGTQKGPFGNIAPTGEPIKISGIDIFRIAGGKIEELWVAQP